MDYLICIQFWLVELYLSCLRKGYAGIKTTFACQMRRLENTLAKICFEYRDVIPYFQMLIIAAEPEINSCRKDRPCQLFEIHYGGHGQRTEVLRPRFGRRLSRPVAPHRCCRTPMQIPLGQGPDNIVILYNNINIINYLV